MADLSRRLFLGTVASAAAGSLVVNASDADIARFAKPGMPVAVNDPPTTMEAPVGMLVFNHKQEVIGVVMDVEHIEPRMEHIDISSIRSHVRQSMSGVVIPETTVYRVIAQGPGFARVT